MGKCKLMNDTASPLHLRSKWKPFAAGFGILSGIIFFPDIFRSTSFVEFLSNLLLVISVLVPSIWWVYCTQKDKKALATYQDSLVQHQQLVEILQDTDPDIIQQMGELPAPKLQNRRWPAIGGLSVFFFIIAALIGPSYTETTSTGSVSSENNSSREVSQEIQEKSLAASPQESDASITFIDGIYQSPDMTIQVTDIRKIAVGEEGNEYGDRPIVAFWYDTTNSSDKTITPLLSWISIFDVIQDNDPNMVNELDVASHPDMTLLDNQSADIKPGGTVPNAGAYYLDDETTPVELVARDFLDEVEYGKKIYTLP